MTKTVVPFSEVEPILDQLGQTWIGDSETKWYRYAWGVLEDAGEAQADSEDDHNEVKLRAIALWAITKSFFVHAFDEGYDTDWDYEVGEAVGERPLLPRPWIVNRVLAEFDFSDHIEEYGAPPADDELDTEVSMMLRQLVSYAADDVVIALSKCLGEPDTFASLWCAGPQGEETSEYPLTTEEVAGICNSPSPEKLTAYAWVSDGMDLSHRNSW
ncbi:hypothetical protein [Nocardia concava]|uniref:hypothetical protein n=1 Tax=Nocardia concava TaxID=257281 RepID=UPI0002E8BF14|nr:hypothetical protein [Nocardia concava]